ncbi:hypothetical protein HK405_011282 [Cladochytrium tenue]|nr:hypothetical protein HK405_011282 [Cladochytrium tenue]
MHATVTAVLSGHPAPLLARWAGPALATALGAAYVAALYAASPPHERFALSRDAPTTIRRRLRAATAAAAAAPAALAAVATASVPASAAASASTAAPLLRLLALPWWPWPFGAAAAAPGGLRGAAAAAAVGAALAVVPFAGTLVDEAFEAVERWRWRRRLRQHRLQQQQQQQKLLAERRNDGDSVNPVADTTAAGDASAGWLRARAAEAWRVACAPFGWWWPSTTAAAYGHGGGGGDGGDSPDGAHHHPDAYTNVEEQQALVWWRTLVVGPLTEEVVFRGCSMALFAWSGWSVRATVLLSPLVFGAAHVHHAAETLRGPRRGEPGLVQEVAARTAFQFAYTTLFGWAAGVLVARTGHVAAAAAAHVVCNAFGFPDLSALAAPRASVRNAVTSVAHVAGLAGFVALLTWLPPDTRSSYYHF